MADTGEQLLRGHSLHGAGFHAQGNQETKAVDDVLNFIPHFAPADEMTKVRDYLDKAEATKEFLPILCSCMKALVGEVLHEPVLVDCGSLTCIAQV